MIETGFGRVLAVEQRPLGSLLDGAHTAGATTILVEDCADFDDTYGGQLVIDGLTYTYTSLDDEASTITLATGLAADTDDAAQVLLLDPLTGATSTEWLAQVTVDGIDPGDSLEATIRSSLVDRLPEGLRGITGENVELQWDETGSLWVVDILGVVVDSRAGVVRPATDTFAAVGGGAETFTLAHTPVPGGILRVSWLPLEWPKADWSLSGNVVTISDALGVVAAEDVFEVAYLYDGAAISPGQSYDPLSVPLGADWKYALDLGASAGAEAPAFDDSAWSSGPSPVGDGSGFYPDIGVTGLTGGHNVWQRLLVTTAGGDLTFDSGGAGLPEDDDAWVYIDGVLVGESHDNSLSNFTVSCAAGSHLIAVYGENNATGTPGRIGYSITEAT